MRWLVLMAVVAMASLGCAHSQRPAARIYVISEIAQGAGASLGTGGAGVRDCQAEHEACFRRCWEQSRPKYPYKHDEAYYKHCTTLCREAFNRCEEELKEESGDRAMELKFSRVEQAIEWLRAHKAEVALGTVVVIAGVAFVVTTGGAGALILAPLAL
jgi:hypothetical protein